MSIEHIIRVLSCKIVWTLSNNNFILLKSTMSDHHSNGYSNPAFVISHGNPKPRTEFQKNVPHNRITSTKLHFTKSYTRGQSLLQYCTVLAQCQSEPRRKTNLDSQLKRKSLLTPSRTYYPTVVQFYNTPSLLTERLLYIKMRGGPDTAQQVNETATPTHCSRQLA